MNVPDDPRIPTPAGHYSPVVEHGGLLFVSGQLPMDPRTRAVPDGIEAQTVRALDNLDNLLQAAGSDREHVLQVRIYVSDIEHWDAVNRTYAAWFGDHKPARAIIPCGGLHHGCLLELEATAAVR
ncbi:MAG: RidA family protein [Planctomycetota bacterium]|jgi:reactive intermediate/imine deaminase